MELEAPDKPHLLIPIQRLPSGTFIVASVFGSTIYPDYPSAKARVMRLTFGRDTPASLFKWQDGKLSKIATFSANS